MDKNSFELLRKDALKELTNSHLQDALTCIRGILFPTNNPELNYEWESIQKDYEMMLGFMQQGGNDTQRAAIFRNLLNRSFSLLDMGVRSFRLQNEKDLYTDTLRRVHEKEESFGLLAEKTLGLQEKLTEVCNPNTFKDKEAIIAEGRNILYGLYDSIFEHIWTAPMLKSDTAEEWKAFMDKLDEDTLPMFVSALMLSLQSYFDPQKFKLLLHICRTEHIKVRARALTAIVWIYIQYEYRFDHLPDLCEGIALLSSEPHIHSELVLLQKQLLLSLETDKAKKKLQDEILPDIMKKHNYQRNKMGLENMEEELSKALSGEPNAGWEHLRGDKKLADNMKEIIEMGKEGVDINIGTFSALKGFPFFRNISHWFVPFDKNRPEVKDILPDGITTNPVRMIMEAGNFCDSDKYSLCIMLRQIMPSQRETIMTQIGSQMDGQEELVKGTEDKSHQMETVYRNYLHDLYRFYKLYPQKSQFEDPFKADLLYTRHTRLGNLFKSTDYLTDMASFLIKRECYQDAVAYIEEVLKEKTATADMLQKLAFCHQRLDNPGKAVYYYQQADLLDPDNEWILKQMYLCYSASGKYELELSCLKRLETINPEDTRLIAETGLCLMQLQRYEEAANRFYELEYKEARVLSSWRAIAWCNFKMNKLEQAYKYYQKVLNHEKASWEDHLNAGHTAWCMNNIPTAVEHYRTYVRLYMSKAQPQKKLSPLSPFDEDRKELTEHGIPPLDITLMRDIILPKQAE